jgi:hypothetical protein
LNADEILESVLDEITILSFKFPQFHGPCTIKPALVRFAAMSQGKGQLAK